MFISLFSVVMKKREKCFNRFEFIFEFFEKRTRFEIPRQLVFLDGRKKRMMIFSGGQTRAKKSAEKSKPKGKMKKRKSDASHEKREEEEEGEEEE